MANQKFVKVPTYDDVLARVLKAPEKGMIVETSTNEQKSLVDIKYKNTLSNRETIEDMKAVEARIEGAIRMVSGSAQIMHNENGTHITKKLVGRRLKTILGHKFWERGTFDYCWEYVFDKNKRLVETVGKIEGRQTFEYDEHGRLTKINDFGHQGKDKKPVGTTQIEYDEQGRIIKQTTEKARFGLYKIRDEEKVKTETSFVYDKKGGFVATERYSIDGYTDGSCVETHCDKDNNILSIICRDKDNNVTSRQNYSQSATPFSRATKQGGMGK